MIGHVPLVELQIVSLLIAAKMLIYTGVIGAVGVRDIGIIGVVQIHCIVRIIAYFRGSWRILLLWRSQGLLHPVRLRTKSI